MSGGSAWARARNLAERTPESRNRYVDLLRAISILAVVTGHWLIAAPWLDQGSIRLDHMLDLAPWTRWLTWGFQVMPVFFIVGGYSNAASWEAARRAGTPYNEWLAARLRRLIGPVVPLLIFWGLLGLAAHAAGASAELVKTASQVALVPTWFLAVYLLVILFVPWTHEIWRRLGLGSFWILAVAAMSVDVLRFAAGMEMTAWVNYLFVWLAVHQLGYAWRDGRLNGPARTLPWAVLGFVGLIVLVFRGPYPLSMVGVPGEAVSNTLPPSLAMLMLGLVQAGLLLSLEGPARRWLSRPGPWTATISINAGIMTVYLWHLTAMVLTIGICTRLDGIGLALVPGSNVWWSTRPVWMFVLSLMLQPFLLLFGRFERSAQRPHGVSEAPTWRLIVGSVLVCGGLAMLALHGIGRQAWPGVRWSVLLLPIAGALLAGVRSFRFTRGAVP